MGYIVHLDSLVSEGIGVGVILGVISLGLTSFFIALFAILFIILFNWVRRQVKETRRYCKKEIRVHTSGVVPIDDGGERGSLELTNHRTTEQVTSLSATNQAFTSSMRSNTYEDTPIRHTLPTTTTTHGGPLESGAYNDVSIGGPLPGFLRNEEILVAPSVSPEVMAAAREGNLRNEEIEAEPMVVVKKRASLGNDDYIDPQDAKNEVAAMRKHDKIIKKVSKGRTSGGPGKRSSDTSLPKALSDRDDYTTVVNALPQGDFERIDISSNNSSRGRPRTSSDVSPMMSAKWSHNTGNSSNSDSTSGTSNFQKSNSVRDYKRPKHVTTATKSPSKTQPIRRRSTLQQKELVSFDPQKGFKLIAKRTNSDGVRSNNGELNNDNGAESPVSDPGRSFTQEGFNESNFMEGLNSVIGGTHMYAAVDLKAKCRPEDDILRREGVGVPEHYIAPVPCS